jgi:hypothetical protein
MCWDCGSTERLERVEDDEDVDGRCPVCGREFPNVDWEGNA